MKKQFCKSLAALCLFAMLAAGLAAQSLNSVMVVRIPFEFTAGNRMFPAGEYRFLHVHQSVVRLEDSSRRGLANLMTHATVTNAAPEQGKLVFHGYSGRYFLAEIWMAGGQQGQVLPIGPEEKEIARNQKLMEAPSVVGR